MYDYDIVVIGADAAAGKWLKPIEPVIVTFCPLCYSANVFDD